MDKEKVLDYVMNTPGNSNRAVLSGMLDESGGENENEFIYVHMNRDSAYEDFVMQESYTGQQLIDLQNSGKNVVGIFTTFSGGTVHQVATSIYSGAAMGSYGTLEGFEFGIFNLQPSGSVFGHVYLMLIDINSNSISVRREKIVEMSDPT